MSCAGLRTIPIDESLLKVLYSTHQGILDPYDLSTNKHKMEILGRIFQAPEITKAF